MASFTNEVDRTTRGVMKKALTKEEETFLKEEVLPIIEKKAVRMNYARKNSGSGRTQVYGYGSRRTLGFGEFKNNIVNPELYQVLVQFGKMAIPPYIPWTAIQVNHNYQTNPHVDGNNIGLSYSVSFGDFTGGELVVEGEPFQTRYSPIIFNGSLNEHYNKPISGDRYSLVYFVSAPPKFNDVQIFQLHNQIIEKNKNEKVIGRGTRSCDCDKSCDNCSQNPSAYQSGFFKEAVISFRTNS